MRSAVIVATVMTTALATLSIARRAQAQVHWDASAQIGMMKRVLVDRPTGAEDAGFGPVGQLTGHVALLPLVRLGGYFGHDISPIVGPVSARDLTWGGLRAKIMSPWPRGDLRAWVFVGFGGAGVYARSSSINGTIVPGAGGGFFEVPFGIGASYKVRKPWELCAELGTRVGFGHSGSAYDNRGEDRFGILLTIGALLDL